MQIYSHKEVVEITGLTPRQVISWSEKGVIEAYIETIGIGRKRGYNYYNLIEFGIASAMYQMGIGFRAVKRFLDDVRKVKLEGQLIFSITLSGGERYICCGQEEYRKLIGTIDSNAIVCCIFINKLNIEERIIKYLGGKLKQH